jgi:hypothetical protein
VTLLEIFDDVSVKSSEASKEDCWDPPCLRKCTAFRALEELWNSVINKHSEIVFIVCCSLFSD